MDERGSLIDGDQIMAACGLDMKAKGRLTKDTVVATVMSNLGFRLYAKERGMELECTDVGDRNVLERMVEKGYRLGGEQSGHMIFLDHATTGDAQSVGIKSARRWAVFCASSCVLASTITRMSASVPEGRTSTRPSPDRASSSRATAWASRGLAIAAFFTSLSATGMLISIVWNTYFQTPLMRSCVWVRPRVILGRRQSW